MRVSTSTLLRYSKAPCTAISSTAAIAPVPEPTVVERLAFSLRELHRPEIVDLKGGSKWLGKWLATSPAAQRDSTTGSRAYWFG
jgi:hypothetical protein